MTKGARDVRHRGNHRRRSRRFTTSVALVIAVVVSTIGFTPSTALALTPNENFIKKFYADFYFRAPTAAENSYLVAYLSTNSRTSMANALIQGPEFETQWVGGVHMRYLGYFESTEPAVATQVANLNSTHNFIQTEIDVLASAEYYALAGSTNAAFVTRIVQDVWLRPPTASEQSYYLTNLPAWGRSGVALMVLANNESVKARLQGAPGQVGCPLTALSEAAAATSGSYCVVLDRVADAPGVATWTSWLGSNGHKLPLVWAAFSASAEYFNNAQP